MDQLDTDILILGAGGAGLFAALHAKRLNLFGVSNKLRSPAQRAETVRAFERDFLPWFADGRLTPVIDRVFDFDDVPRAHAYFDSDGVIGKVVVRL